MSAEKKSGGADVLAVIRAPLEQYPPSIFQVALLAEAGLRMAVVDLFHPDIKLMEFRGQVERIHAGRHTMLYKEQPPPRLTRFHNTLGFIRTVRRAWRELEPKVVIAYDDRGCPMVGKAIGGNSGSRIVSHFHELSVYNPGDGWGAWQANRYCRKFARQSDLVIFPDRFRAEIFTKQARLPRPPSIVMNCPRKISVLPANALAPYLKFARHENSRVVFFQGWMGPHRGLESLIRSMTTWPADSVLVLVGPAPDAYRKSLIELAAQTGVTKRLLMIGMVSLEELNGLIAGADVAVALFPSDTDDLNFRYLAGASNKRFMYMSLGVAQVANTGPGMSEIIEQPKCGLLVNPNVPEEVGRAICQLLTDETMRKEMGQNGRQAHLNEFNYERQFAPVLEQIVAWTKA